MPTDAQKSLHDKQEPDPLDAILTENTANALAMTEAAMEPPSTALVASATTEIP